MEFKKRWQMERSSMSRSFLRSFFDFSPLVSRLMCPSERLQIDLGLLLSEGRRCREPHLRSRPIASQEETPSELESFFFPPSLSLGTHRFERSPGYRYHSCLPPLGVVCDGFQTASKSITFQFNLFHRLTFTRLFPTFSPLSLISVRST